MTKKTERRQAVLHAAGIFARDLTGLAGCCLVVVGVHLIYEPASFIVAGGAMLTFTILSARRSG